MERRNKSAEIRSLARQGLTPRQIAERGFNIRTVYDAVLRNRRRQGQRQLLEEILAICLETLKQVRGTELP
jgi:hypothetical protein